MSAVAADASCETQMTMLLKYALGAIACFFSFSFFCAYRLLSSLHTWWQRWGGKAPVPNVHDATNVWLGTDALGWLERGIYGE
jgi:hypothetical protein